MSHRCPALLVLNVFYSASSAATELSQPQTESLELPKNPDRYFWLPEIVTTGASLCLRDAAAGNRNKYSSDLWRGYHSVNGRGSKLKRLQREQLLLGTATVLLTLKSETNKPHTESYLSLIFG